MIRFVRASTIKPGKLEAAMAFAKDISAYVESTTGVKLHVFLQVGGVVGRICWQSDNDDMAAVEKTMGQLLSDPEYLKKISVAGELFLEGQTRDSLWVAT